MPDLLVPFLITVALLTITPGPDMLLVLRNGLQSGSRIGWMTGVGCCLGIAVHYVLTRDDVINAANFGDAIARCGAPVEDHADGTTTRWEYVGSGTQEPTGKTYGIPLRSLLPIGVEGLIVAGRCLSATHDAHASVRSMGQCMAMGHAAGVTAAHTSRCGQVLPAVEVETVRAHLEAEGAVL